VIHDEILLATAVFPRFLQGCGLSFTFWIGLII
jgi:hypothetical protein